MDKSPSTSALKQPPAVTVRSGLPEREPHEAFYSPLTLAVESAGHSSAPAMEWSQWLGNLQGIKREEIQWSGVAAWLRDQEGQVTREALVGYLRDHEVHVGVAMLGDPEAQAASAKAENISRQLTDLEALKSSNEYVARSEHYSSWLRDDARDRAGELEGRILALRTDLEEARAIADELRATQRVAKFGDYQTPGGRNYREMLLTFSPPRIRIQRWQALDHEGQVLGEYVSEREARQQAGTGAGGDLVRRLADKTLDGGFRGGHFEDPNVIAHVRFNERVTAAGVRTLFIEEIQSDWHQLGRRHGYQSDLQATRYTVDDAGYQRGDFATEEEAEHWRLNSFVNPATSRVIEIPGIPDGVPDGPFKKTWALLAVKRMIRYAAETDFDHIAWTTGDHQARRYGFASQVGKVEYTRHGDAFDVAAYAPDGVSHKWEGKGVPLSAVEAELGKEVADKVETGSGRQDGLARVLTSGDLTPGGKGMRAFYDRDLVNEVRKYIKKWNSQVSVTSIQGTESKDKITAEIYGDSETYANLPSENKRKVDAMYLAHGTEAHSLTITPQMRAAALAGQPLFSRHGGTGRAEISTVRQRAIEELGKGVLALESNGILNIVTASDLPEHLIKSVGPTTDGVFDPDTRAAYILADRVSLDRVKGIILHEVGEHYGLRGMLGHARMRRLISDVREMVASSADERFQQSVAEVRRAYAMDERSDEFVHEVIARYAEAPSEDTWWKKVAGEVRGFLHRIGLTKATPQDVSFLVRKSLRRSMAGEIRYLAPEADVSVPSERRMADIRENPRFQEWFADSKAVDDDGAPLVVYHGTTRDFDAFDAAMGMSGPITGNPIAKYGFFFSGDPGVASHYAEHEGGNVMPALLSLQKPYRMDMWKEFGPLSDRHGVVQDEKVAPFIAALRAEGYDGIILTGGSSYQELMVFDPWQVKSIFNRGSYDPAIGKVLESRGGDDSETFVAAQQGEESDSTLVDRSGAPLVFYHGSNADFEEFACAEGDGIYFSTDAEYAGEYGEAKALAFGGSAVIYSAHLSIRNALELDATDSEQWEQYTHRRLDTIALRAQGYDGVVMRYACGEIEAMAFSHEQVRRATTERVALPQLAAASQIEAVAVKGDGALESPAARSLRPG